MIYVGSPYSSELKDDLGRQIENTRFQRALEFVSLVLRQGGPPVFSPVVYCHPIARANKLPGSAEFWHNFNMSFLRRADLLYVLRLPGWENSKGLKVEMDFARIAHIGIVHYDSDFNEIILQ